MPPLHDQGKDMRKWDGDPTWTLEAQVQELQEQQPKGIHPGKLLLQCLLGRVEGLILLLTLMKGLLVCSYKNQVMKTPTRTRKALALARWRKETTGFTGLCGFHGLAHQAHGSIKLWWTLAHSAL